MLLSMKDLENYSIAATDGIVGELKDLYFDDDAWVVRYLVVQTGSWLSHRKVLISPTSAGVPEPSHKLLSVSLTRVQVRDSPGIDTAIPVSRQHEESFLRYYGYPNYWGGVSLWDSPLCPATMALGGLYYPSEPSMSGTQKRDAQDRIEADAKKQRGDDPHLRSASAVMQYRIHAKDGTIGHVQSILVDEKTWAIRYLIVKTSDWWLGHEVLIAPEWIVDIDWVDMTVSVDLVRQAVKDSPSYDSSASVDHELETGTYKHYGKEVYSPPGAQNRGIA